VVITVQGWQWTGGNLAGKKLAERKERRPLEKLSEMFAGEDAGNCATVEPTNVKHEESHSDKTKTFFFFFFFLKKNKKKKKEEKEPSCI
jgi:hypothetical protein